MCVCDCVCVCVTVCVCVCDCVCVCVCVCACEPYARTRTKPSEEDIDEPARALDRGAVVERLQAEPTLGAESLNGIGERSRACGPGHRNRSVLVPRPVAL